MKKTLFFFLILIAGYFLLKQAALSGGRKFIEYQWKKRFGTSLTIERIDFSLLEQSLTALGIVLKDRGQMVFDIRKVRVSIDFMPLLKKKIAIRFINIYKPNFFIYKEGKKTNIGKVMTAMGGGSRGGATRQGASQKRGTYPMLIQKLEVNDFTLSYVERFPKEEFNYEIRNGEFLMTHFSYPSPSTSDFRMSMNLPKKGKFDLNGKLSSRNGKYQFNSQSKLQELSLTELRDFFENQYSMTPRSGLVYVNSKINMKGNYLSSNHQMILKDFEMEMNSLHGVTTSLTTNLLKNPNQKDIQMEFSVNADLSSKNIDWFALMSSSISQSFFKRAAQIEPKKVLEDTTKNVIQEIEKAIPLP